MKKYLLIASALTIGMISVNSALALDLTQGSAGETATFDVEGSGAIPGAKNLDYTPSNNVVLQGDSDPTGFLVNAYHNAALGKAAGQAYAMTADSNSVWFFAIEDESDDSNIDPGGTNSGPIQTNYSKI